MKKATFKIDNPFNEHKIMEESNRSESIERASRIDFAQEVFANIYIGDMENVSLEPKNVR